MLKQKNNNCKKAVRFSLKNKIHASNFKQHIKTLIKIYFLDIVFFSILFDLGSVTFLDVWSNFLFAISNFFALISLSTSSIIARGAQSPYLKPVLIILLYPPFLSLYLSDRTFVTLIANFLSCSLEKRIFLSFRLFFFPSVIILSIFGTLKKIVKLRSI